MINRTTVNNIPIIEIDNFLTPEECDQLLIDRIPKFKTANTHYPKYYRNNNRLEDDNSEIASDLFSKVSSLGLDELNDAKRLNDKLRFCEYNEGQMFSKHQDGVYFPNDTEASTHTFLLYLNGESDFKGGETQFFDSKLNNEVVHQINPNNEPQNIIYGSNSILG